MQTDTEPIKKMLRLGATIAVVAAMLALHPATVRAQKGLNNWRSFAVPHGTPMTVRPPDSEVLKLLPPARPLPAVTDEQHDLGFALWWGPQDPYLDSMQPPVTEDLVRKPVIRTPPGETEFLVMGFWGLRDGGNVVVFIEDSPLPLTIRHVEFVPRYVPGRTVDLDDKFIPGGRVVGFATFLPENATALIRRHENAALWLNVDVPSKAKPGTYTIKLKMIVDSRSVHFTSFKVEVLDFALPRADIAYGMFFRPHERWIDKRYLTPDLMRAYWRDMARHGMTSATLENYQGLHDGEGNLALDGVAMVEHLDAMIEEGLVTPDVPVIWLGGVTDLDAPYATAFRSAFKEETIRRGWPELLMYSWDEPPVDARVREHYAAQQPLRRMFRLVTAISDVSALHYADQLDCMLVHAGQVSPQVRNKLKEHGCELWNYSCQNHGTTNWPFNRFYAGIYTWALNLKGNFFWAYFDDHHAWEAKRDTAFCWVLPSEGGPVPSVAWEARREGVEDYRTLRLLERRIAAGQGSAVAREASAWLDEIRGRVDWYLARDMPPSTYSMDGRDLYPLCPNFQPDEFGTIRRRAVGYIEQLKE